ncbi:hypothetical protein FIU97_02955 [Roseivivax sp. THAF40]|uniref:hypothetical protein n=1 Tax=unclassified Roseivivax TaxID=2639302 RepID=UPI001268F4CD|nr:MULTISPECIES: hypothetical protein [unclassified Roseivivax]QFS81725.1 hypothetical protein FIV09_02695 [Roseivivax sp. THAF197b]QFT45525.1 hypothetical protein FIU97_02955 [Roseivivax sp. THAF40]
MTRAGFLSGLALAIAVAASPAAAHRLNVFAFVEDGQVVVEAKFSTGRLPVAGEVRVYDAAGEQIQTLDLGETGTMMFPLDPSYATGLTIEVEASEGHEDYWILSPDDIAKGAAE